MTPQQYGAALMQAYLGKASLAWIAEQTGISLHRLRWWRKQPEFLLVMDWSKSLFSATMQESLLLNDYTVAQYHHMAAEISLLEESLRVTVRVPAYRRFKKTAERLLSEHHNGIPISEYDLRLFRRLFLFFLTLEHHWPSAARRRIHEDFLPLARDVAWPLLRQTRWVGPALESLQQTAPLSQIRLLLSGRLKEIFQPVGQGLLRCGPYQQFPP
jgi:hypothetical protein